MAEIPHSLRTVEWRDGKVIMIDQTKLPSQLVFVEYDDYNQVADAIRNLVVRGGSGHRRLGRVRLGSRIPAEQGKYQGRTSRRHGEGARHPRLYRPTAVNLKWGLDRIMEAARREDTADAIRESVTSTARQMAEDDIRINRSMGKHGANLLGGGDTVMTPLQCRGARNRVLWHGPRSYRAAKESGKDIRVIATETRPVQQGSRLTAFELQHDGIDVSLIPDTAVGYSMANRLVDKVIVGADRILRTGHVYNKIGTYQVATMAKQHGIPFYVAAPLSTSTWRATPGT